MDGMAAIYHEMGAHEWVAWVIGITTGMKNGSTPACMCTMDWFVVVVCARLHGFGGLRAFS